MKKICRICGKEFITYPSVIKNNRGICCSRKCADKWHSIQLTGKHLSESHKEKIGKGNKGTKREDLKLKWRKYKETGNEIDRPIPKKETEFIEYICEWCGKKWTERKRGIVKSQQRHFCCNLHRSLLRSEKTSGKNNYFYGKNLSGKRASNWQGGDVKYNCLYCGKKFYDKRSRKGESDNLFCSIECYHEWYSGKNNHAWQGGISFEPYGIEFNNRLRKQIRERDNYICQLCGEPQNGKRLSIHHIDYNKQNNNPNNLISLCDICHIKTNTNREYWKKHFNIKINEVMSICQ